MGTALPASAQTRMQINGKQASAATSASRHTKHVEREDPIVQRSGTLEFDRHAGWSLGRQSVIVSRKTMVISAHDGAPHPSPRELEGRRVMLFGKDTDAGFDALLIVLARQGLEVQRTYKHALSNPRWFIPSETNDAVGETTEQVPR